MNFNFSFSTLKAAYLLIGWGIGVEIAFLVCAVILDMYGVERMTGYASRVEVNVYYISVLLFGGIGLLVSF
ncbi:hypothetical protein [Butyricimonas paravirosa]|uniref:hypothetical protein n=1 Tax=Butyricimonas paravirosa TaxID=1472417 RepID=UPI0021099CB0|nr:hypothetical protein [Butyricimonas paravirosa]MCQ4872132.1 hypothetical protein [Butyricimonas paravirosa]